MIWDDSKIVAGDLETSGEITHTDTETGLPASQYALQPWRLKQGKGWITSGSILRHDGPNGMIKMLSQLFPTREQLYAQLLTIHNNGWWFLGWNVTFDVAWLMALGPEFEDLCLKMKWLDGMLMERHFDIEPEYEFQTARHKKKSYALKGKVDANGVVTKEGAMQRWLPSVPAYNEGIDFHSQDPENLARLQAYNDKDNLYTFIIARMIWHKLTERQRTAVLIEAEAIPMVAQANLHGIVVDQLTVKHLGVKLDADAAGLLAKLAPDGMREDVIRSPVKLGKLLFDDWRLPVLKTNKSKVEGKPDSRSTDKEVLHELAFIDARAKDVKSYREALNSRGKFCESVLMSVQHNENGCTHPTANIFSTYTGRMTVSSQQGKGKNAAQIGYALHQMKRESEFREFNTVPEGYDLVEFDAAGQEFRWMAVASGDPTMLNLCQPGEDPHSYMGAAIVGIPYRQLVADFAAEDKGAKQNRYLGKFANLSLQYRTSARKLRVKARIDYNIPLEMPEAHRIHQTYQREYPGVPGYWERQIALVKQLGYVETFGGNRVRIEGDWGGSYGWSMGSTAINYRIQGTGADQKHLAMAVIKGYLREIGGRFLFDLHDGLYLVLPTAKRETAMRRIKQLLDNLPYQQAWGFTPPIPMPWDAKWGKAWGRMREMKFD